jgi:hypothetical protein
MNNPHIRTAPPLQFAKIPNNIIGRLFLWTLRRWLNKERYSIMTRGRKPKRGFKNPRYAHDLPKAHARQLGVYIVDRWQTKATAWKWHEESKKRMEEYDKKEKAKARVKEITARLYPPLHNMN